ncbi:SDR family oxidoreductase [Paramixta manurensis]|uniref:SDR family oxidoreductase n=1 Tax=Paramixta manurensis TaxID=2740817 RepID=A0A6M8UC22_9GAMM|nr:SDR family oxidoreductase [Erwiniaceae bacterium PD-1]
MKTILITGCSSGFGLETAKYFLERDWKVIATMRTPRTDLFPQSDRLSVIALDVTDPHSIARAVEAAGPIDVLVNNAGVGMLGALEGASMASIREIFATNTLGTIALTQAVIPQFRQRQAGTIVNVTSTVTVRPLPLLAVYTGSKAAVNAFTESLALELAPHNIRVRLVLPGAAPGTRFGENCRPHMENAFPEGYGDLAQHVLAGFENLTDITQAADVAEAVWRAVTDTNSPMRLPAGADAVKSFNAA